MDGRDLAIDRISDMPNALLTKILSLLTTREAVRTCILSKRWTDLWTCTDTLDFGNFNFGYDYGENRFLQFVHGVLNRRGFSPLDKFKLTWWSLNRSDRSIVEECISHAVACMPQLIYIYIGTNPILKLPDSLLNCGSVKEMSLRVGYSLYESKPKSIKKVMSLRVGYSLFESKPKSINLPSLQKLEIGYTIIDDDLIKMFLLGCPVLEELALTDCWLRFKEINSNVLKKLTIKKCSLQTSLRLYATRGVLGSLNKDIPNCLILNNLKSLELGLLEKRYDWNLVVCFLQHTPNLKKLVLNFGQRVTPLCKKHYREKKSFPREFLELVEIRVLETRVKKETEEMVVMAMGALVKTIGKIVTL